MYLIAIYVLKVHKLKTKEDFGELHMRVAICDDNKVMSDFLNRHISNILQNNHVDFHIDSYCSGSKLKNVHVNNPYDILFLDICMPEVSGFDLAETIRSLSQKTVIVFVTSNEHLVFESFQYQPFYFIRKTSHDVMLQELEGTLNKLINIMKQYSSLELASAGEGKIYISAKEILYIECKGHYLHYITTFGKDIVVRGKLSEIEDVLHDLDFIRIHRSYIINMHNVFSIEKKGKSILLANNTCLKIGRNFEQYVEHNYMEFIRRTM